MEESEIDENNFEEGRERIEEVLKDHDDFLEIFEKAQNRARGEVPTIRVLVIMSSIYGTKSRSLQEAADDLRDIREDYAWDNFDLEELDTDISSLENQSSFDKLEAFHYKGMANSNEIMNETQSSAETAKWMAGASVLISTVGILITISLGIL